MPLARVALYQKGITIYISPNTNDNPEWQATIDPFGHYLSDPVWDLETIIYADLDMSLPAKCKMEHDPVGHYARPDVLNLTFIDSLAI